MNVLIIGSGGRESAMAWKIAQSKLLTKLYIAPGNPGTEIYGENVPIDAQDFEKLAAFSLLNNIELMVVGPEVPLVLGIKDFFNAYAHTAHISVIGPDSKGAILEGSKDFSKEFMQKYGIPTAEYATFSAENLTQGLAYLHTLQPPYVLKADGLAAGKGVIITSDMDEAKITLTEMIADLKFGEASAKVVIEAFLSGIEVSVFVITDGKNYLILPEAKDYKRIGEGDTGPNTGGMGAVSPVGFANAEFMQKVEEKIIIPTISGLANEGIDYRGFVFFGLIKVGNEPVVIEYNCRLGDPETEVVMPRIKSDLLEILTKVASQQLNTIQIEFEPHSATTIMCVSGGYPDEYQKGDVMSGFENLIDVLPFHAGTKKNDKGEIVTSGGRVIAMTALGKTKEEALIKSRKAAETISWKGKYYRKDIGFDV